MARLVSLLGMSPGTPHTVACLLAGEGYRLEEHVILATNPDVAREALGILSTCPCAPDGRPPGVPARVELLPFNDIREPGDLAALRRILGGILDADSILDLTGGRKLMAVAAALEALNRGSIIVSAIISDEDYRRIRDCREPCGKSLPWRARLIILY
ncbi:MAG: hypothetical protein GSR80_000034 [Desulfurococcales archaeon]|nr:hypothetical protein [Desulfurococcales archaeon]